MTDTTKQTGVKDSPAKEGAGGLADEASRVADDVRDQAEERADRWTDNMGRRGAGLARALGAASDSLRGEGDEEMAELAERAAEQVERMAGYLEQENPGALLDDLSDLGRSNPAAFLGTAFAAGVLSGRVLRASSPDEGNGADQKSRRSPGNGHDRAKRWSSRSRHREPRPESPAGDGGSVE